MSHELPSDGKFRQFESALDKELRADILAGNLNRAMATRGLMKYVARLHARNLLTFEGFSFPDPEQAVEAVTFTNEERKALLEVRTTQPRFYLPSCLREQRGAPGLSLCQRSTNDWAQVFGDGACFCFLEDSF
mgnify:CR=1 FL=1